MNPILEARVTPDFWAQDHICGHIHSCTRKSINLLFSYGQQQRLISILPMQYMCAPDSLGVPEDTFVQILGLPVGVEVQKSAYQFLFSDCLVLNGTNATLYDSAFQPAPLCNAAQLPHALETFFITVERAERLCGLARLPVLRRTMLYEQFLAIARKLLIEEAGIDPEEMVDCLGYGPGLTPSADDVLVGILSVAHAALQKEVLHISTPSAKNAVPYMQARTTAVSVKYLTCALEGRFYDAVVDLNDAIFGADMQAIPQRVRDVASIGSTSGIDILFGIAIGFHVLWPNLFAWTSCKKRLLS